MRRPRCAIPITISWAPARGGDPDRLVEHRHHRVEALERELLLAQEAAAQVELEALDLREPLEQRSTLLGRQRLPVPAGLDRLPQPDALGVVGEVLDLVGDRAAVDVLQRGQRLEQRLAGDVDAEHGGRDASLELRRQWRDEARLVERGIAERLGAERIEPSGEMAVHAVRLDERHGRRDGAEQRLVDRLGGGARGGGARVAAGAAGGAGAAGKALRPECVPGPQRGLAVTAVAGCELEQPLQTGMAGDQIR